MAISASAFVVQLLIAALVYFLGDVLINLLVTKPDANRVFHVILLIAVILIALFGGVFLPKY